MSKGSVNTRVGVETWVDQVSRMTRVKLFVGVKKAKVFNQIIENRVSRFFPLNEIKSYALNFFSSKSSNWNSMRKIIKSKCSIKKDHFITAVACSAKSPKTKKKSSRLGSNGIEEKTSQHCFSYRGGPELRFRVLTRCIYCQYQPPSHLCVHTIRLGVEKVRISYKSCSQPLPLSISFASSHTRQLTRSL